MSADDLKKPRKRERPPVTNVPRLKRRTRSYYLTEEATEKVDLLADQLDMSASEVVERMIQSAVVTGDSHPKEIDKMDLDWARAATGGREPAELVVYQLELPYSFGELHGTSWGATIPGEKGPLGVLVRLVNRQYRNEVAHNRIRPKRSKVSQRWTTDANNH